MRRTLVRAAAAHVRPVHPAHRSCSGAPGASVSATDHVSLALVSVQHLLQGLRRLGPLIPPRAACSVPSGGREGAGHEGDAGDACGAA